ncbi:MAG: hypothetical protein IPN62_17525 [Flavobacteriales bacterium]|nr:hypothetical protein [Flavobacteriales bacterium]
MGDCFGKNRTFAGSALAEMPDPKRNEVRWQKGATELIIDVSQDCKFKSMRYFANSEADVNKVLVEIECISEGCSGQKNTARFLAAFDSQGASQGMVNLPVLLAGKRYRVRVEPQGEAAYLGFFDLATTVFNTPFASVTFNQNTSCVFDLGFQK